MFKLLRYFSITSLISILVASLVLAMFYRQLAIGNLLEMGERHNVDMTRAFANALWPLFEPAVQASLSLPPEQMRALPDVKKLHDAVYAVARGLSVAKIKVYNLNGIVAYSSDEHQIGDDSSHNEGLQRALRGEVASEFVYRDKFSAFEQVIERSDLISTYMPILEPGAGRIVAVFELYDNVTDQAQRIRRTQYVVIAGLLAVFAVLYGVLFVIVGHAARRLRREEEARRQSEGKLRDSQEQLARTQYAVDHAADMVFWTDHEGRFIYVNETSCNRLGYSCGELMGMKVSDIDPNYPREAWPALWDLLKREGRMRVETIHCTKSGEEYPAEVVVNYVTYDGAEFSCAFARDITERKRTEADLISAKEAAEAAGRAKANFLANMGHELRTPLNAIIGMTEVTLMESALPAAAREHLDTVRAAARDLLAIINAVLEFSEVESGRVVLAALPFSLRAAVQAEIKQVEGRARGKGLALEYAINDSVPDALVGDVGRLRQVLRNLLDNAVKFTSSGGVTLSVEAFAHLPASVGLNFSVQDTGVGIPADKRRHLFEAFVQADASATRRYGGTGLGLAICARIVQLMGGEIWVEGAPDRGSAFHFTARFPVAATAVV
jgi:PAS domain S-box-containing protein